MNCSIEGCPGKYESGEIIQTLRHRGQVVVIDHVPAELCSVCGDTLLDPETVRRIETLLQDGRLPAAAAPLFEFA